MPHEIGAAKDELAAIEKQMAATHKTLVAAVAAKEPAIASFTKHVADLVATVAPHTTKFEENHARAATLRRALRLDSPSTKHDADFRAVEAFARRFKASMLEAGPRALDYIRTGVQAAVVDPQIEADARAAFAAAKI